MIERPTLVVPPSASSASAASATSPAAAQPEAKSQPQGPSFGQVLRAIGEETRKGEALVERAVRAGACGRELSPGDLLALQAGVYRWVEVVDLASKLVDRAAQAAKTVTQGNG